MDNKMDNKLDVMDLDFKQKVNIISYTLALIEYVRKCEMSEVNRKLMDKIIKLDEIIDDIFDILDDAVDDENTDDFEVFLAQENILEGEVRLCIQFLGVSIEEILEELEEIEKMN